MHERQRKSTIFISKSLESDTTTVAKYKVDANDETYVTEQIKQNLTMHLVEISAYDVESQIGRCHASNACFT